MLSFEERISKELMKLVEEFAMPWFERCIQKYTEEEWHRRMHSSWNLYEDWQQNHYAKYWGWIKKLRKIRHYIIWDSEGFTNKVVELLNSRGWKVDELERKKIYETIKKVERDIYS